MVDLVGIFEKILSIKYPHELIYYSLYYYGLHFSFKKGIDPILERAIKWVKNKPPIHEREKEKMTLYASFCDTLIDKLKDPPNDNPFNTKGFNTDRHISVLPNLIESIFQENKEYKNLDRQVCLNLAISVLDIVWNNTSDEDQVSIEKALTPFKEELQKTFQNAQKEILKILRHWEDQDYLPPKLVYESHFNSVEVRREEELKRLEYYVPLELEVKLSQKGGGEPEEARSVLLDCLDKKRNAIIIGESGSGKTFTFLKLFGELKKRYFNDEISFIPLFIELYKFNPPHEHVNLETFLQQYLVIDANRFHKDKEKYILFLDGLNESPNLEEAFKEIITAQSQGMRIFLSTQREEDFFKDKGFSLFDMLPLGEEEVIQYLSYCPRLGDKENARALYQKLDRVLKNQIKRPVFLFFTSLLYEETGNIPTSLGTLLSSFTDFLCERKLAKGRIGIGTPFDSTYKRKVLPYMAFSMCKENKRELKETELEKLFEDIIPNDPHDYDEFKKQVSKKYWLIRQSKKDESFEFTHELLRDYFTAAYIKDKGMAIDEVMSLVFKNGKSNPTFVSVVQLLCGIESEERVGQLITDILKQDPFIAASCFALSTITNLPLFYNIHSAKDINYPNFHYLDRLPQFYLRGLELLKDKEGQPKHAFYQGALGTAYWKLSEVRDKEENLERAIIAYKEALKVRTFKKYPLDYAQIQNNLGNAYSDLSEVKNKEENLERAIIAYKEALKVRTFKKYPQGYAQTQNNLGNAYSDLSEVKNKEENLERAIGCFREALKVDTKDTLPWYFVQDSYNFAKTLDMKGDTAGGLRVMEEMLPVAEEVRKPQLEDYRRFYEALKSSRRDSSLRSE